ncbi:MAG: acetoacetate--CoA ligase [Candidatus Bathyarchaeota archaeon]|nr:MAG: acetoacetate--CoA ligase [Candidatus Bathyarchaeota archaeon]
MRSPLWKPSEDRMKQANITKFTDFVNNAYDKNIGSYYQLYMWSIENLSDFWAAVWKFVEIKASRNYEIVVDNLSKFPGARWFVGAKLNFAENLLKYKDPHAAFVFKGETKRSNQMTYLELHCSVARLAKSLRNIGVVAGDRVAAYMPNLMETAIAMIATTSTGAIWSSCGAELGPKAVLDRFSQIEPKVLFTTDAYYYKGKIFNVLSKAKKVADGLPSLERIIVIPYIESRPKINSIACSELYSDFLAREMKPQIRFAQLPFNHPVYIMFSSGTTGKPKCMVQGAGGVLINHLKELILHADLKRQDNIFYITTPSWMMWNWLISSLAVGATVILYDGNPTFPDWRTLWQMVQDEKITIFGCSASYINYLNNIKAKPGEDFDLSSLREVSQTGSPLSVEGFEYVYNRIKKDVHLNSISGGTDINGCFAAGTPVQSVYAGELQGPALGMKIKAYNEIGASVIDQQAELICEAPSPSMPLNFWDDPDGEKYRDAYFKNYPEVWRHGDWILIHGDTGGITFLGRSDFTLKPSGVRIGPSEIYNVVEKLEEVADSLVVGQKWMGDQRIILFVKPATGFELTETLKHKIKASLRVEASPRHVPALIIESPEIPYTFNMKKVESAISNILNGRPVLNKDALVNPESLDFYAKISSELQETN